jgi:hypothetical protein
VCLITLNEESEERGERGKENCKYFLNEAFSLSWCLSAFERTKMRVERQF